MLICSAGNLRRDQRRAIRAIIIFLLENKAAILIFVWVAGLTCALNRTFVQIALKILTGFQTPKVRSLNLCRHPDDRILRVQYLRHR